MRLHWTAPARADLDRIFDFLASKSPSAAERALRIVLAAPVVLLNNPSMGVIVETVKGASVRRLIVDASEVRYRVTGQLVEILRVFHTREDR